MAIAPTGLSRLFREPEPDPDHPETPAVMLDGPALAAIVKTVELQLRQVPLATLTAEVLPAMLAIFEAPAGALLLYRREDATLTLAAARGLAVSGAETLDVLRWGDEHGSEMPLRALVDRKIYVVERPEDDPFTSKLIEPDGRRAPSVVAAIPLYRWHLPVGVLLVLGDQPGIAAEALLAPTFAYSVLALALSTMLWARDERGATPLPAPDSPPPPLICVPWVDRRQEASSELARLAAERDAGIAAARAEGQQLLAAARDEGRAALEAGIEAARTESRSALDLMLQELRAAVSGMEAERQATAQERTALGERLASFEQEHGRLAEQLASAERDRNLFASRFSSLEQELARRLEAAAAAAREAAVIAPPPAAVMTPTVSVPPPAAPAAPVAPPPPATPAASVAPTTPATPSVAPAAATGAAPIERRVLESDGTLRDHIQTALASGIPAGRGSLAVVNLLDCDAARLADMAAAADAGLMVVAYAAHPTRGSRILGPIRCFTAPPSAVETTAAVEGTVRGNRRTITLSEDIDAFMPSKTALTKAGHSVSMACDEKQALDLLAILRPDTVLVDARGAGQPIVEFLDALGPESGRILTLLVHGDPTGATLAKLADRMLRANGLDVSELVKVCRNALPEAGKRPATTPVRR